MAILIALMIAGVVYGQGAHIGPYDRKVSKISRITSSTMWGGITGSVVGLGYGILTASSSKTREKNKDIIVENTAKGAGVGILLGLLMGFVEVYNFGLGINIEPIEQQTQVVYNYKF